MNRTKVTFPAIDMSKPIPTTTMLEEVDVQDCFTFLWEPTNKFCLVCADIDICGILFHKRQSKQVKNIEKEKGGYLDNMHFDSIDKTDLVTWLSLQPRTTQQLIDKVTKFSKCPDAETVAYWCKSFILETEGIGVKKGIVTVK